MVISPVATVALQGARTRCRSLPCVAAQTPPPRRSCRCGGDKSPPKPLLCRLNYPSLTCSLALSRVATPRPPCTHPSAYNRAPRAPLPLTTPSLASPLHSLCFGQQQVATLALEREARARPRHGRVKAAAAPAPSSPPLLSHPLLLDQNLTPPRLLVPRLNRSLMRSRRNVTSVSFQRRRTRTSPARSSPLTGRPRPPQPPHTLVVDPQPPHGEIPAARGLPFMFPVCPRVGRMETHPSR